MLRHGVGSNVGVRVYLEGRLVERGFLSVTASANEGAPATAQINMTPTNSIKHILYGTWVHVFTTDPWDLNPKGDLSDYKLLFEGVVVGRGWTKEGAGRAFQIRCADPSIFWVEAKQYWLNVASAGNGFVEQVAYQTSSGEGLFTTPVGGTYSYVYHNLSQINENNQERFLDTILATIDDVGNVNPHYTNNRNRFRITDRIIRAGAGKIDKLFQFSLLGEWINELANRVSSETNLATLVNQLLAPVYHEWVSLLAPPYVRAEIFARDSYGNIIRKRNDKGVVQSYAMATEKIIASSVFKPDAYTLSPPTCNVLMPMMYEHAGYSEDFLSELTRLTVFPQHMMRELDALESLAPKYQRPVEVELFSALIRNTREGPPPESTKRTPDGTYSDNQGQSPRFHDYDWGTNEERIRGIVSERINMAPAATSLSLSDPGATSNGGPKGGTPKYLQNVVSYEWFKRKYANRQASLSGPYNMRPVVGFPVLALDDSDANLSMVAHLGSVTHQIDAQGHASTSYGIIYPRLVNEVDLNRPNFTGGTDKDTGEAITNLAVDAEGNFSFEKVYAGTNKPPIPEWFSDDYATLTGLDKTYQKFFGNNVHVVESIVFNEGGNSGTGAILNDSASLEDAVAALVKKYRSARDMGKEFEEAAAYTARDMAKIDEAFRFVGAGPSDIAKNGEKGQPVEFRKIDYSEGQLKLFVGDISTGSGYSAESVPGIPMSGAIPIFDTKIHSGGDNTDQSQRDKLRSGAEAQPSAFARYDGRPVMYDFENRIWNASKSSATPGNSSSENLAVRDASAGYKTDASGANVVPLTATETAAQATTAKSAKSKSQKTNKETLSHTAEQQSPTGDSLETGMKLPLPQPLSERQIVQLRRSVVEAYAKELENDRGFAG